MALRRITDRVGPARGDIAQQRRHQAPPVGDSPRHRPRRREPDRQLEAERERPLQCRGRLAPFALLSQTHGEQEVRFDVARMIGECPLEVVHRLRQPARALEDAGAGVAQVGEVRVLGQRAGELRLGAREIAGVVAGEPEVGARLGGVHGGQTEVGVARIAHLDQHGVETLRRALELPAVEMQDALVVMGPVAPLHEAGKERHGCSPPE